MSYSWSSDSGSGISREGTHGVARTVNTSLKGTTLPALSNNRMTTHAMVVLRILEGKRSRLHPTGLAAELVAQRMNRKCTET
jgi:hypothetical protein